MSYYIFPPQHETSYETYAYLVSVFTPEECDKIIALGESLNLQKSVTVNPEETDRFRKSENSWIPFVEETKWIYDRLAIAAQSINHQFWRFKLSGFYDSIQFTKYQEGYFYDWHKDCGGHTFPRKLSLVVQLTDEKNYEGGNLEFFQPQLLNPTPKTRGTVIFFPSNEWHCVKPVASGIRNSLVAWIS